MRRDIVILAVSVKHKNLCVAGIDLRTNKYIRLVSDDCEIGNAIHRESFKYSCENGYTPAKLSVISVETSDNPQYCFGAQSENYLLIESSSIDYVRKEQLSDFLFPTIYEIPFGTYDYYLNNYEYQRLDHSIEVLHVYNLNFVSHVDDEGKRKTRVNFLLENGEQCRDYPMTDGKFFNEDYIGQTFNEAFIVVTVGTNDDYGGSAKFVASILQL